MKRAQVMIDSSAAQKLLRGEVVKIRVPADVQIVEVRMQAPAPSDPLSKLFDVFFNGRPA